MNSPVASGSGPVGRQHAAEVAYRRAWWSLVLYPVSFVAAFVVGEGLYSRFGGDAGDATAWAVVLSAVPAVLVFIIPGVLAVVEGMKAVNLGRPEGRVAATVGAVIGLGFIAMNLFGLIAQVVLG
jgi:hypothetical protein